METEEYPSADEMAAIKAEAAALVSGLPAVETKISIGPGRLEVRASVRVGEPRERYGLVMYWGPDATYQLMVTSLARLRDSCAKTAILLAMGYVGDVSAALKERPMSLRQKLLYGAAWSAYREARASN